MKRLIALLCLLASPALADHLFPEPSPFSGNDWDGGAYFREVLKVLKDVTDDNVILKMIELPSFVPERAVGVRKTSGQYKIFTLLPQEPVWGYGDRHAGKIKIKPDGNLDASEALDTHIDDPTRMSVAKCEIDISPDTESVLAQVWEKALLQTRYGGDPQPGVDGASYHFAMRVKYQFMAGYVWSPQQNTTNGKLVSLALAMGDYCEAKKPNGEDQIRQQASNLLRELQ